MADDGLEGIFEVPKVINPEDLCRAMLDPKYGDFNPFEAYRVSKKNPKNLSEQLRRDADSDESLINVEFDQRGLYRLEEMAAKGMEWTVEFRKQAITAFRDAMLSASQHRNKLYLGFKTPWGIVRLGSCFRAARRFTVNRHETLIDRLEDGSYKIRDNGEILVVQEGINVAVSTGYFSLEQNRPDINGQQCMNFNENQMPVWTKDQLFTLLHRHYNEGVCTPIFFPILTARLVTIAKRLEELLDKNGIHDPLMFEAMLNRIVLDKVNQCNGLRGILAFYKKPINLFVEEPIDYSKHPAEWMYERFDRSGMSVDEFYAHDVKPKFEELCFEDKQRALAKLIVRFTKIESDLGKETRKEYLDILNMINEDQGTFPECYIGGVVEERYVKGVTVSEVHKRLEELSLRRITRKDSLAPSLKKYDEYLAERERKHRGDLYETMLAAERDSIAPYT